MKKENIDEHVLFFVYYSGHGYMNNLTYGISGQTKDDIPIEGWVRKISLYHNVFTIAFFDCCRDALKDKGNNEL
jgi:hypothetical protein